MMEAEGTRINGNWCAVLKDCPGMGITSLVCGTMSAMTHEKTALHQSQPVRSYVYFTGNLAYTISVAKISNCFQYPVAPNKLQLLFYTTVVQLLETMLDVTESMLYFS